MSRSPRPRCPCCTCQRPSTRARTPPLPPPSQSGLDVVRTRGRARRDQLASSADRSVCARGRSDALYGRCVARSAPAAAMRWFGRH
ncbi:hypothetical protein C8T65DRAFT_652213 [Cerioporus squamosus]|nr:hypothetical protein C8T65DRAFT_652213 [Cerioporus squamosus]